MPLHPSDRDDEPEPDGPVEPELPQPPRKRRPRRLRAKPRELDVEQILTWADEHFARTGRWPTRASGPVGAVLGETWNAVDKALRQGSRGLPGGSSLPKLLARCRGYRNIHDLPPLTEVLILGWADAHFERRGLWPTAQSGPVEDAPGETWHNLNVALQHGSRGLPGGGSLARLLAARRGRRNRKALPPLTEERILAWADEFHALHGRYPTDKDGEIPGTNGDTWALIDGALYKGLRGLPGGSSLPRLLDEHRGVRNRKALPHLTEEQILAWAQNYQARHGRWPNEDAGPVAEAPGETWAGVNAALGMGLRGLPGGTSLYRLLLEAGLRDRLPGH